MKILFLVESPGKIAKIKSILSTLKDEYTVMASVGHIRNLDSKNMSIDIDNNFTPKYIIDSKKKDVVSKLKTAVKNCDIVYLAADEDREGEAIAQSLVEELKIKKYKRVLFNEITKKAIINAIDKKNLGDINMDMVNSQKSRMILDKIVGYSLSPLLWHIENRLSGGRVQSPVVKLIVERENEIKNFSENSFYKINASFNENELKYFLNTITKKQKAKYIGEIYKEKNKEKINSLLNNFKKSNFKIKFIYEKESSKNPSPPYITSSLQQDASTKLSFNPTRTMSVAQELYKSGKITYMRTDSTNLSKDALQQCKTYIESNFGEDYYQYRTYSKKSKNAQEAHEAIRPTRLDIDNLNDNSTDDMKKLYNLIWKQTMASQMATAKIKNIYIQVSIDNIDTHYFESSLEEIIFLGFLKLFNQKIEKLNNIPKEKTNLTYDTINAIQEFTKSIGRYTEASLVKTLEKTGIGRPSTFASMISKIQDKRYVEIKNINGEKKDIINYTLNNNNITEIKKQITSGNEKKKLVPTNTGIIVTEYLNEHFPDIMDYQFTANMESQLDLIAENKLNYIDMLNNFYSPFNDIVLSLKSTTKKSYSNNDNDKLLGKIDDNEVYLSKTKRGINVVRMDIKDKDSKFGTIVDIELEDVTLEIAKELLRFPYVLGKYEGKEITINKFNGLYIKHNGNSVSCDKEVTLEEAIELLKNKIKTKIKSLTDGKKIYNIRDGKYGPYVSTLVNGNWINKKIPKSIKPKDITLKDIKKLYK